MTLTAPPNLRSADASALSARQTLRRRLLADREQFAKRPQAQAANDELRTHLARLLQQLEPELLGIYWPIRSEFNAIAALDAAAQPNMRLALPYARREPREMHYRAWDGGPLAEVDECGLATPGDSRPLVPDVVLAPCVGYTRSGYRLGYGGGYFDRWLAGHPQVTAIGIAWSCSEIAESELALQPHDRPLTVVLTERGVVG